MHPDAAPAVLLREAKPADFEAICALNLAEEQHTSAMDVPRLVGLHRLAAYHKVACRNGEVVAFLLAMRRGAPYPNRNFAWFEARFADFVYVDRIVVSARARGLRLGSRLYDDLFAWARSQGIPRVACEYNLEPPNEPSRRFHDGFGFTEQGTQRVAGGSKLVSMQTAPT